MTKEEMLARAQKIRNRDLYGKVSEEELNALPAGQQTECTLDVGLERPVHIYVLRPNGKEPANPCPMILNFHGGGFIKGRQDKDRIFCSKLADTFGALVWDVDYSLAPEYPFPTAAEECYAVAAYAASHAEELGIGPAKLILLGHSAGGNLAAAVCLKAGETHAFKPLALGIEFCPMDLSTDPATKPRVPDDMPAEVCRTYNAFYCDPETAKSPYASPLFAAKEQLAAFPDTLIMTGEFDSLCFEGEEFAMKLAQSGVAVTCKRFLNCHHGWTLNRTEEWESSTALLFDFIHQHLSRL